MERPVQISAREDDGLQFLWDDGERVVCRGRRLSTDGSGYSVLMAVPAAEHPSIASLERLAHEYELRDELDGAWAVRPLDLVREATRTILVLEDPRGELLARLLGTPMEIGRFLSLAAGIAGALGNVHQRGLVHKDVKTANVLVNCPDGQVRLTGFGIASRLPRERQPPEPPEVIAGTLAYMAPEQTGRMNRSIDSRSDLYALGVTFYQMLTGLLPFAASDPMEWVHCHIARRPVPPQERVGGVPERVAAIIMKLLAKTAEERYQTAGGVERDLRRCLAQWEAHNHIGDFPLGEHDTPDRLLIPEKLYGRAREVETMLASFDRIINSGAPELVLVSGYSGIGKSSVVNELHKALVPPRGLFASGKFDQYKRDVPYATLAQAFQNLIRPFLGKSEADLVPWRNAISEALGTNGQLMVDLVPELTPVIGDQPPIAELPPQDAQRRFQLVFRRFIGVFARPEHPLALFLDDLQWLDAATLDLLEDLLIGSDLQHLMLIGAYRDNEVTAGHPLIRKLDTIKAAGGKVAEIKLAPLAREHVGQLIADALRCEPKLAAPLAELVHAKTGGNPFFAIQFISSLAGEGLLTFDHSLARWSWDIDRIHTKGYTDNIVDLMVGKLTRLPAETQTALQQLACLGNIAETRTLAMALGTSEEQVHTTLWPSVSQELVERFPSTYRFLHDRVQEAAYSLVPENLRGETHLRIGRLLAAHTPAENREEAIFDIVNHLNRGAALISSLDEREQLAEFNLLAGKRARASTAYASALTYLSAGEALLAEDRWERCYALTFALELHRAECEFLTGELAAETRLAALSARATNTVDRAAVTCLQIDLYTTWGRSDRAIAVGLDNLRLLGLDWSANPTEAEARRAYEHIWSQLGDRRIEQLIDLPLMRNPASLATLDVLSRLVPPAYFTDVHLGILISCRAVSLSIERGNHDESCVHYQFLGTIAGVRFGHYQAGFSFGKLGCDLVEQRGLKRLEARTLMLFGALLVPWTRHVRECRDPLYRALETATQSGDLIYAAYSYTTLIAKFLTAGDPLAEVQREAEQGLAFAQHLRFGFAIDVILPQLGLIRTLRGLTPDFGTFDDTQMDERQMERHFADTPDLALAECLYWIRKLQARFLAGDHRAAVEASWRAQRLLSRAELQFEKAEYHFFSALAHAASCDSAPADRRQRHWEALTGHHAQLQVWAENGPANFEDRAALVAAEIARLEGRELDAPRLYEQAIRAARANEFIQNEAIAYERTAHFYMARAFGDIATMYLRKARYCYRAWGADAKVRRLDELYPHIRQEEPAPGLMNTIQAPVEHLDLATVIKVSQSVSGEIVLDKLIDTLMRTAIEQAGAERGVLILARGAERRIAAEATTAGESVIVHLRDEVVLGTTLPESVLHYVVRSRESVILDDAAVQSSFATDPYIRQRQARSVCCLPLLNQAKLIGLLYLENNLAPGVFAPARTAVLKLLAFQAATALQNTGLYRDLADREAKIRRLVDANIIGIFIRSMSGEVDGPIVEANDAFLRIVEYGREDLSSGRIRWAHLSPPEWHEVDARAVAELKKTGILPAYEKEYFRKDGSRVPVLVGAAILENGTDAVAFVLDLSDRKRAEAEARDSERRYREVQSELAHGNRVAAMGQLTASIAHEIRQPLSALMMNGNTALRWLTTHPPEIDEVRQAIESIVKDANRANDVISRIHGLVRKAAPSKDPFDINEAILEVVALVHAETLKQGVATQTQLADNLPRICGDRVQLQQVLINLAINAIQAMSGVEGVRALHISTAYDASEGVCVAVRDTGPGLCAAKLPDLFEPFYTTKPSGMGMGLSICRSIIEDHGGRLWASEYEPKGALFQFTIPVKLE